MLIQEEDKILFIPKNLFFLFILFFLALILFILKKYLFKRYQNIQPYDIRKTAALDGHPCYSTLEAQLDNFLFSLKIPHDKPEKIEYGKYFTHSNALPNFIVYKGWNTRKIHSLIIIEDMERPLKKYPKRVKVPEVKPRYPVLEFKHLEIMNKEKTLKKLKQYYAPLLKEIKEWARREKQNYQKK